MRNGLWMDQIARNLTDSLDGILAGKRYLIHDRDPLFTKDFVGVLAGRGCQVCEAPAQIAQPERLCRAIRPQHQGMLPGPVDPVRGKFAALGDPRVYRALPSRAESSGPGEPVDPT